jgi:hypothetical protein
MGSLSITQLIALAINAGWSGSDLATAVSVALAESGGNPNAYNPETAAKAPTGKGSYGLWQIYLNAHPEFSGENLYDPATNAAAAFQIYSNAGNSFTPWSTFKNGAYLAQLPQVNTAVAASAPPAAPAATDDSGDDSDDTGEIQIATDDTDGTDFTPGGGSMAMLLAFGALTAYLLFRG